MSQLIVAPSFNPGSQIAITEEGSKLKDRLLSASSVFTEVPQTSRDCQLATRTAQEIQDHLADIESMRTTLGAPFYATWKQINETAKEHVEQLQAELKRVSGLIGTYEQNRRDEEKRHAAELERQQREAQAEADRLAREAREAEERTAQATENKLSEEDRATQLAAQIDADERREAAEAEARRLQRDREQNALAAHSAKAQGTLRKDWNITVTDMRALLEKYPQCVKLEAKLQPIKDLLNAGLEVPGVTATPKVGFSVK